MDEKLLIQQPLKSTPSGPFYGSTFSSGEEEECELTDLGQKSGQFLCSKNQFNGNNKDGYKYGRSKNSNLFNHQTSVTSLPVLNVSNLWQTVTSALPSTTTMTSLENTVQGHHHQQQLQSSSSQQQQQPSFYELTAGSSNLPLVTSQLTNYSSNSNTCRKGNNSKSSSIGKSNHRQMSNAGIRDSTGGGDGDDVIFRRNSRRGTNTSNGAGGGTDMEHAFSEADDRYLVTSSKSDSSTDVNDGSCLPSNNNNWFKRWKKSPWIEYFIKNGKKLLVKYWIWLIAVTLMVMSISGDKVVIFRIFYMFLFLGFLLTFQVNFLYAKKSVI